MRHTLTVLFHLRKAKADKSGQAPVYMRITIDGKRVELTANRKVHPDLWDDDLCRMKGTSEEARILNNHLDNLKQKVNKQFNVLESLENEVTAESIKNMVCGVSQRKHTLISIFQYHNDQFKQRIGSDYAEGTYKRYVVTLGKLKAFLQYQYHKSDFFLDDLNHQFITNFELYLKTIQKIGHNTTAKYIKNLKKVINMAVANEWLQRNPFMNFKCAYKETHRGYLTSEELRTLEEKELPIKRLEIVRDIFIFQCYTGLAYSDVEKLSPDDISTGIDGEKWIIIYRKKTGGRSPIPLLPKALEIIEKYKDFPINENEGKLLPVKSNQKINAYLKEIATICDIDKNLSTHLARHTFATTVTLANGVPIESVSKMLGHTDIRTTQIYSKVIDSKISADMQKLKQSMSSISDTNVVNL
ncbi:MAG: site-specific integrase [Bacteroidetes bacterium]|nr:site-specific integrase [Bacteroidota bacterium]